MGLEVSICSRPAYQRFLAVPFVFTVNILLSKMIAESILDVLDMLSVFILLILAFLCFIWDYAKKKGESFI